jgi:uncharacterized oxidoreductase
MELTNNTILITGGTSGFGFEFAKQLFSLGNTVIITGRNEAKLEETKKMLPGIHIFQSDVSDPKAIEELFEKVTLRFPDLNVLINNAGEMRKINLQDTSNDVLTITREIEINLSGPIRMVQEFLPFLKTKKNAAILNVTSALALIPFPVSPVYGATKSGLRSYTKSLRVQLKNINVKIFELLAPAAGTPLIAKFNMSPKSLMPPEKVVAAAIKGMQKDTFEIYPGIAKVIHILSRLAPGILFTQLSKPVDIMMAEKYDMQQK